MKTRPSTGQWIKAIEEIARLLRRAFSFVAGYLLGKARAEQKQKDRSHAEEQKALQADNDLYRDLNNPDTVHDAWERHLED